MPAEEFCLLTWNQDIGGDLEVKTAELHMTSHILKRLTGLKPGKFLLEFRKPVLVYNEPWLYYVRITSGTQNVLAQSENYGSGLILGIRFLK